MQAGLKRLHHGQMSESFYTAMFLSLSGGLQDAYTYLFRGKVFANAQTGNIVLLSQHLFAGEWDQTFHYLVPLLAFALGVFVAELLHGRFKDLQSLHWRQLVILLEIVLLFGVGFFPQEWNLLANALVSFACAMQVQTFRKVNGYGCVGIQWFGRYAVWGSCLLLVVSFILMFIKEDIEENPALSSELHTLQQDVHKVDVLLKEELHEEHEELRESLHHDN